MLIQGNALDVMRGMVDDSFDVVITSPPYNMNLRIRNGKYCSRQIVKELSTKYDGFSDNMPIDKYLAFQRDVINECLRLSPMVFYNVQFLTGNKRALFKIIGEFSEQLKEIIVWDKIHAQPAIGQLILNSQYEVILVFDRDNAISRKFGNAVFERGTLSNCWAIPSDKKKKQYGTYHGAVFPVELIERIVHNFTTPSDRILDPFVGTGTVGVVCRKTGNPFTGVDISMDYLRIAKLRMSNDES